MNYNDKNFRTLSNTPNGEISELTIFHYKQTIFYRVNIAEEKLLKDTLSALKTKMGI